MELPIALIAIIGWMLWTIAELQIEKSEKENDGDDKTVFTFGDYAVKHWPLWIGSLLCIPVILWIGDRNLDINPLSSLFGEGNIAWHDLYILGSGAAFEIFIFAVKKIKKMISKKEKEL